MRVYVNDRPVDLIPGMTVRHALIASGIPPERVTDGMVRDSFGNMVGLDGEPAEGERFFVGAGEGA